MESWDVRILSVLMHDFYKVNVLLDLLAYEWVILFDADLLISFQYLSNFTTAKPSNFSPLLDPHVTCYTGVSSYFNSGSWLSK